MPILVGAILGFIVGLVPSISEEHIDLGNACGCALLGVYIGYAYMNR